MHIPINITHTPMHMLRHRTAPHRTAEWGAWGETGQNEGIGGPGTARQGKARHEHEHGTSTSTSTARHGTARHSKVGLGGP